MTFIKVISFLILIFSNYTLAQNAQDSKEKKINNKANASNEDSKKNSDSEKGFKLDDIEERYKKLKPPPLEERLRIAAEIKRENALSLKENLEWLQEDIEIDYINQEKKMVAPFDIVDEVEVDWDIQSLDIIDRYNIGSIKNHIPVQFKVEQMAKGGFKIK